MSRSFSPIRWGWCLTLVAAPLAAQDRAAPSLDAAEKLSRETGRPILAVAGSET